MSRKNTWNRLLRYTERYRLVSWGALLSATLSVGASLIGPQLIGKVIDLMVGPEKVDFKTIMGFLGIMVIIYALGSLFNWLLVVLTNKMAYQSVNDMRQDLFAKLNELPLKFHDNHPHGDSISRFVNDTDAVSDGLLQGFSTLLTGILTLIGAIVLMIYTSPMLTLVVLLLTPVAYMTARFITVKSQKLFKEQAKVLGNLNGYVEEMIGGQKVVQALQFEDRSYEKFTEENDRLYHAGVKAQFFGSLANPSTRLVNNLIFSIIAIIGCVAIIRGHVTIGGLSAFVIYTNQFAKPFNEITGVLTQLQGAIVSAQRIFDILDLPAESPDAVKTIERWQCKGSISFEQVSFSYNPGRPLITDFSLQVNPGMRVAIVGHTGAGKTTLVNLLMRYYDVDSGSIKIDGTDINEISRDSLRRCFGMVLQDTWLFAGTIRDNIAYGKPEASEDEIIAAAKAADAHSFIKRLPNGYDTLISASGDNLSQGQKQLLTIARVMLVDPPVLILDEATSSIDTRTEIRIQQAFQRMIQGRTSFVIAHRLSTVREADLILYMMNGNIVESGTHEQLLSSGGHYAQLYNSQFALSQ